MKNILEIKTNLYPTFFKVASIFLIIVYIFLLYKEILPKESLNEMIFSEYLTVAFMPVVIFLFIRLSTQMTFRLLLNDNIIEYSKLKLIGVKSKQINTVGIESINVSKNMLIGDIVNLKLKNGKKVKIQTYGLDRLIGTWQEPSFNDYMPMDQDRRNTHKIAYNISKKYNIPFESEFID